MSVSKYTINVDKISAGRNVIMSDNDPINQELLTALMLVLDCVDYTGGACSLTEMVGAVLPKEILARATAAKRKALGMGKGQ